MISGATFPRKTSKKIVPVIKKKIIWNICVLGKSGGTRFSLCTCMLFIYICRWAGTRVHMRVSARGGKRGIFLNHFPLYFLRQSLSEAINHSLIWLDWLASKVQRSSCLCLASAGITGMCYCTSECWGFKFKYSQSCGYRFLFTPPLF